ncbi:MAG TPA: PAS domain S-box protein [Candidatus Binatia bacterium]|nr:PAS domain S-box protein [Candidatus Binatia bacterium]
MTRRSADLPPQVPRLRTSRFALPFHSFSEMASAVVVLIGAAVLVGWFLDNATLKSLHQGLASMKPNDAVGFILAGGSLWMLRSETIGPRQRRIGRILAIAVSLIGLATFGEYFLGWDLGIDQIFFRESKGMIWTSHPGRMAPSAALNFILLGIALFDLDPRSRHWLVEALTVTAILISLVGLLAHLYALELLHGTGYYTHMAFHSTAAFCLLATGILFARPDRGLVAIIASETAGGAMTRRLFPAVLLVPGLLAWSSFAGQRAGYYQTVFGLALLTLGNVIAFSIVVLWSGRSLYDLDLERERTDAALWQNRERFRLVVDGARDYAIFLLDADGYVRSWNPGAERIIGYSEGEVLGRHLSTFYPLEDVAKGKPERNLDIAVSEGRAEDEGWRVRKDGSRFWANVILAPLIGEDGRLSGFSKITRDMTERRRIEEQLKDANTELRKREQALQETLSSLTRTHEALKNAQLQVIQAEKMESVGRLAAGVAHEVKNPLAVILSGVNYLSGRSAGDETAATVLSEMQKAIERADQIVGGLLDFSAPRNLELASEDLNAVVEQALVFAHHEIEKGRVTVVRAFGDLPFVRLDRRKMEQVFVNVFLNAIQAMPRGGTLTVKTYVREGMPSGPLLGSRATHLVKSVGRMVVAQVDDTGTGIPDGQVRKVFEPFFTTKPTRKGTGLGLTVTKAIVDMHGGKVEIRNRPGGGARVLIVLDPKGGLEDAQEAAVASR